MGCTVFDALNCLMSGVPGQHCEREYEEQWANGEP
jgi:hypothetical protein